MHEKCSVNQTSLFHELIEFCGQGVTIIVSDCVEKTGLVKNRGVEPPNLNIALHNLLLRTLEPLIFSYGFMDDRIRPALIMYVISRISKEIELVKEAIVRNLAPIECGVPKRSRKLVVLLDGIAYCLGTCLQRFGDVSAHAIALERR